MRDLGARAHDDDHALRLGMAEVVEEAVGAPGQLREAVHRLAHDVRAEEVEAVAGLSRLEEDVGILRGSPQHGLVGRQRAEPVGGDRLFVQERLQFLVAELLDLGDLVGGTEPVEEVEKRDAGAQSRGVRDGRKVLGFLDGAGGEQGKARLPAGHHVGMVAEDRQRVRREGACGHVHAKGGQLSGDLVHVGNHQQEALRRREGRGQSAGLERAVHRPRGAPFRLHLNDVRDHAPEILAALRGPLVGQLAHRRGRRDRIDCDDFARAMRDRRRRLVAVNHDRAFDRVHRGTR